MKNTLFLSGLMALCCGAGMAATVAIDLNGNAADGTSLSTGEKRLYGLFGDGTANITADKVVSWLQDSTGWMGSISNSSGTTPGVWGSVTASGADDVSVSFLNRNNGGGSNVGTEVTLTSDYANYTGLTLSVDCAGLQTDAYDTSLNLVYQTADGWQLSRLTDMAANLSGTTWTLSANLNDTPLTSDKAYIVMSIRKGFGNTNSDLLFSMSATVEDAVPEPATASLGLLGLAGLMMRRRRK